MSVHSTLFTLNPPLLPRNRSAARVGHVSLRLLWQHVLRLWRPRVLRGAGVKLNDSTDCYEVLTYEESTDRGPRGVGINCLVALEREAWRNESTDI